MKALLAVASAAFFIAVSTLAARADDACSSIDDLRAYIGERIGSDAVSVLGGLTGDKAQAFVADFNSRPPVSSITADTVVFLEAEAGGKTGDFVALMNGGCIQAASPVPQELVRQLIGQGS